MICIAPRSGTESGRIQLHPYTGDYNITTVLGQQIADRLERAII